MTERTTTQTSAGRWLGRVLLVAVPIGLVIVGAHLVSAALTVDPRGCHDPTGKVLPAYWLIGLGALGLLGGRFLGWRRYRAEWLRVRPEEARHSELIGILAFMVLVLATACILVYEAVGVQLASPSGASLEPITYYVRCAAYDDLAGSSHGLWTAGVVLMISGLMGHWLWSFHTRRQHPDKTDVAAAQNARG